MTVAKMNAAQGLPPVKISSPKTEEPSATAGDVKDSPVKKEAPSINGDVKEEVKEEDKETTLTKEPEPESKDKEDVKKEEVKKEVKEEKGQQPQVAKPQDKSKPVSSTPVVGTPWYAYLQIVWLFTNSLVTNSWPIYK